MTPLLGAGINLIGGLLGGRSAKKAEARQRAWALEDQAQQFIRLRDAAEAGGFNPLTALRANPAGGMVNPTPALASGEFVANALQSATSTYFNAKSQQKDAERDMLEKALMRQELANMQAQGKAFTRGMSFGYEIPTANNYTGADRAAASPDLSAAGGGRSNDGLVVAGIPVTKSQNWSDAEIVSGRYGDVVESLYGIGVLGADGIATARAHNVGGFLADAGDAFWRNMPKPRPARADRIRVSKLPDYQWAKPGRPVPDNVDEAQRLGIRQYTPPRWPSSVPPTFGFFP